MYRNSSAQNSLTNLTNWLDKKGIVVKIWLLASSWSEMTVVQKFQMENECAEEHFTDKSNSVSVRYHCGFSGHSLLKHALVIFDLFCYVPVT